MNATWILVTHRSSARLFEKRGRKMDLIQEIEHEETRLADQDLNTDKPSRAIEGRGVSGHSPSTDEVPTHREAVKFARELAGMLEDARTHHRYSKLVLVAEPRFLGELRSTLTPQTNAMVTATLGKNLGWVDDKAIQKHLENVTWP